MIQYDSIKGLRISLTSTQTQYVINNHQARNIKTLFFYTMKSLTGLLGCFLLIWYLQEPSLAAPTHVKRDQEYRNALFDAYGCRVLKAAEAVRNKLDIS